MDTGLKWLIGIACVLVSIVCAGVIAVFALAVGGEIADEAERRSRASAEATAAAVQSARDRCIETGRTWRAGACYTPPDVRWSCRIALSSGYSQRATAYEREVLAPDQHAALREARTQVVNTYGGANTRVTQAHCGRWTGSSVAATPAATSSTPWTCSVRLRNAVTGEARAASPGLPVRSATQEGAERQATEAAIERMGGDDWSAVASLCWR